MILIGKHSIQIWFSKKIYQTIFIKFFPPDLNKFVYESIKDKIKTDTASSVIGTQDKYLRAPKSAAAFTYYEKIYTLYNIQTPSIFIMSDLYLRDNK